MTPYTYCTMRSSLLVTTLALALTACAGQKPIVFHNCTNCPRPYFCNTNSGRCEAPDAPRRRWGQEIPQ